MKIRILVAIIAVFNVSVLAQEKALWKAGVATAVITPEKPMRMAGYAARIKHATGKDQDLFGKALAIEDQKGNRVVFITLDLIGVTAELRAAVKQGVLEKYKLPPHALVMNASHTHCGPAYGRPEVKDYFDGLVKKLIATVGLAIGTSKPARLSYAHAKCGFAMNRRTPTDNGFVNHPNPKGPVDHSVPVLRVDNAEGKLKAVLFGYACHNTCVGSVIMRGLLNNILRRITRASRRCSSWDVGEIKIPTLAAPLNGRPSMGVRYARQWRRHWKSRSEPCAIKTKFKAR